jgi:hypothetical protein
MSSTEDEFWDWLKAKGVVDLMDKRHVFGDGGLYFFGAGVFADTDAGTFKSLKCEGRDTYVVTEDDLAFSRLQTVFRRRGNVSVDETLTFSVDDEPVFKVEGNAARRVHAA